MGSMPRCSGCQLDNVPQLSRSAKHAGVTKVVIHARPANQQELERDGNESCLEVESGTTCKLYVQGRSSRYKFKFDNVFGPQSSQIDIYNAVGIETVDNLLSGVNSAILAYGPTGAGKTHTMLGDLNSDEMMGLAPRIFEDLFSRIDEEQATMASAPEYKFVLSAMEFYNETITDLLAPESTNLALRIGTETGTYVEGLSQVEINSTREALRELEKAMKSRKKSSSEADLASGRSHFVLSCVLSTTQKGEDGSLTTRSARLVLVDLAGIEGAKASDSEHIKSLDERNNVHKSVTFLGRVFDSLALAQKEGNKNAHIPYRDSKLIAYIQDHLDGNGKTTIIAAISPTLSASRESLHTLQFVERAIPVKNRSKANQRTRMDARASRTEIPRAHSRSEEVMEQFSADDIDAVGSGSRSEDPDPDMMERFGIEPERFQGLEDQPREARHALESVHLTNKVLVDENNALRAKNAELERKLDGERQQSNYWKQKFTEEHSAVEFKSPELQSPLEQLDNTRVHTSDAESSTAGLLERNRESENITIELKQRIRQLELMVQQLEREKKDLLLEKEAVGGNSLSTEEELAASHVQFSTTKAEHARVRSIEVNNSELDLMLELQEKDEALKMAQTKLKEQAEASAAQLDEARQRIEEIEQKLSVTVQKTVELQLSVEDKQNGLGDAARALFTEKIVSLLNLLHDSNARCEVETAEMEEASQQTVLQKARRDRIVGTAESSSERRSITHENDTTVLHLERRLADTDRSSEQRLKHERIESTREVSKSELQRMLHIALAQSNALKQNLDEKNKHLANGISRRDQIIDILRQEISEKDAYIQRSENYDMQTLLVDQSATSVHGYLTNVGVEIAAVDRSRASAVTGTCSRVEDRNLRGSHIKTTSSAEQQSLTFECSQSAASASNSFAFQ